MQIALLIGMAIGLYYMQQILKLYREDLHSEREFYYRNEER